MIIHLELEHVFITYCICRRLDNEDEALKNCAVSGCSRILLLKDPHDSCAAHSICSQSMVFVPCHSCLELILKLTSDWDPVWRDIFTFRMDQLRWCRKEKGLGQELMYFSKSVKHHYEVFDSSRQFDDATCRMRVQNITTNSPAMQVNDLHLNNKEVSILSRLLKQNEKATAKTKSVST